MTLETIYYIGQTVAVIAIIISLSFVGLQMRQNDRTAQAQIHQEIADAYNAMILTSAIDGGALFRAALSEKSIEEIDDQDLDNLSALLVTWFKWFENAYFQHKNGFLTDEYFEAYSRHLIAVYHRPAVQIWWRARGFVFAPEVRAILERSSPPEGARTLRQLAQQEASADPVAVRAKVE